MQRALRNELRLLEAGMRRSEQKLQEFEARYGLSTVDFVRRYESNELEETLDYAEWIGEYRLRERLREKAIETYFQQLQNIFDACPTVRSQA